MKSALVLDQDADLSTLPEAYRDKIAFRTNKHGKRVALFPKGTEFEGDHAVLLCRTGQAEPIDDECAAAVGKTAAQLKSTQLDYLMNTLGINDKGDRELYRAGVILGYDDKLQYIPGPNWEKYQTAKKQGQEDDI